MFLQLKPFRFRLFLISHTSVASVNLNKNLNRMKQGPRYNGCFSTPTLFSFVSTVIPRKLAVPNSRNSQTRDFSYLVLWKPLNWLFAIKIAPYFAVFKFAVPFNPTPKIREFEGITVLVPMLFRCIFLLYPSKVENWDKLISSTHTFKLIIWHLWNHIKWA